MTAAKSSLGLLVVAVVVGLPFVARWLRPTGPSRCALDGIKVEPLYQVRIADAAGASHRFCCVRCAERWLELHAANEVHVTDEASGEEIEATTAWFVVSTVATNPITRNRVHTFRERADAEAHARDFHGVVLTPEKRSLQIKHDSDRD